MEMLSLEDRQMKTTSASRRTRTGFLPRRWVATLVTFLMLGSASTLALAGNENEISGGLSVPSILLDEIEAQRTNKDFLFPSGPLDYQRKKVDAWQKSVYEKYGFRLGAGFTTVYGAISKALPGTEKTGMASTLVTVGTWELFNRGQANQGQFQFAIEGRWNYTNVGPEALGFQSIGSSIGTADTFDKYVPTFIFRQGFWQQGSPEAGWSYRIGKITPDGMLGASQYFDSTVGFMPLGSTGPLVLAPADSGLGVAATWYPTKRFRILALISDANADRMNFGDIGAGDFYKAIEFQAQIAPPRTPEDGFSTLSFFHTDGTKDGLPANGESGNSGWGFMIKHEQSLSKDGRHVGIWRYGKNFGDPSLLYTEQASFHYVLKDPPFGVSNDLLGVAYNWVNPTDPAGRNEQSIEVFYRSPLFPTVDVSVAYQAVINPAFNRKSDLVHVINFRIRKTF